jgi:hypothetical protein
VEKAEAKMQRFLQVENRMIVKQKEIQALQQEGEDVLDK